MLILVDTFNLFNANAALIGKPAQAVNKQANNLNTSTLANKFVEVKKRKAFLMSFFTKINFILSYITSG